MHIPDGFLSPSVCGISWLVSLFMLSICVKKVNAFINEKIVPLMGVMSAFIFSAQMLNFPVAAGTSGHLLGGVLSSVLLGPWAGAIVITCVLTVQCFIFQDGGVIALGANILNMAIIGTIGGYFIYRLISKFLRGTLGILAGLAVACWCSVLMGANVCALELALSGTSPLKITLTAMTGIHALIGIGEAVISVLIVTFILKARPDLVREIK
ncbi:cobalamin (vitamin B12) biosynthesis protein CbiM [Candidatus Omnitrophus magneticus]|uniref:Cobalamin (Vitamin B12) biosynthesis protein CbiM n=1 Tax=Candidatus Omnitrophus magneticus TaxID=1609969 RepID=A0A0F0CR14_9BACT|nr:cobalamin (vitamin B12) biosynthesis protein CbiM [Candidatus Omnitrophus magneticus]KJJ85398.1 cobalamin (vitamin B12) biosynthesis protein CbiM [Candidatus Omnitrophus magneticus]